MKVKMSQFLTEQKEKLKEIILELSKDYKYVSILGVDTKGTSFNVSRSESSIGDSMWNERGFVIRIFNGTNYSEYSFNSIDENVSGFVSSIKDRFNSSKNNLLEYPLLEEEEVIDSFIGDVSILPTQVNSKEKIEKLITIKNKALTSSDEVVDFRVNYLESHISKMFLSNKKEMEQSYVWSQGSVIAIVRRDEKTKFFYDSSSGLKGVELIDELEKEYKNTIDSALKLLDSDNIIPGEYDIICAPDVSGLIAHEAFGHGVEMDMFVKKRAKAQNYLNDRVGSNLVSMYDGAKSANHVSSYLFDDEGTLGSSTKIIDNGILKEGISDILSALKLGTVPTGNGKRESYERKAYARMTNTFFTGGTDKLDDMIASIDKGYLLEGVMSGMEDPKNWGIQCMLAQGKEIINGKLTGKIVSPVIMTGYVPDVLNSIDMISKEVVMYGSGACGKGYKEWVKTSDGGPFIKAKGRLG